MTINLKPFPKSYELYFGHPTPPYTHTHILSYTHIGTARAPLSKIMYLYCY